MYHQNQKITDEYFHEILHLLPYHKEHTIGKGGKIQMACPFCFASESKEYKRSKKCSAFFPRKDLCDYYFSCFRCHTKMDFNSFLMHFSPILQKKYHREMELYGFTGKNCNLKKFRPRFVSPKEKFDKKVVV